MSVQNRESLLLILYCPNEVKAQYCWPSIRFFYPRELFSFHIRKSMVLRRQDDDDACTNQCQSPAGRIYSDESSPFFVFFLFHLLRNHNPISSVDSYGRKELFVIEKSGRVEAPFCVIIFSSPSFFLFLLSYLFADSFKENINLFV